MLSQVNGITGVNIVLDEVDAETHTLKITIDGQDIKFNEVEDALKQAGAVVHSIDQVIAGKPSNFES